MLFPLLLVGGGLGILAAVLFSSDSPPVHEPDLPPTPGSTGYKRVDAILPQLKRAASDSGIPLGLIIAWIAKESGGKLEETTRYDERGLFQLMPDESKSLGLDHERLSTDLQYSIDAGIALIRKYMGEADSLNVAPHGSTYFWLLTKYIHTVGLGDVRTTVNAAKAVGQAGTWSQLEDFALGGNVHTKHSPAKWFPFMDSIYELGAPFGFGSGSTMVAGWFEPTPAYTDIPDPLALIKGRR